MKTPRKIRRESRPQARRESRGNAEREIEARRLAQQVAADYAGLT